MLLAPSLVEAAANPHGEQTPARPRRSLRAEQSMPLFRAASAQGDSVPVASGLGLTVGTWGTNTLKAGISEWTQEAPPKPVSRGSLESQAVLSDGRTHSLDRRSLHASEFPGRKRRDVALPSGNLMLEQRRQRPRKGQGMTRSVCGVTSGQSWDRGPGGCACESRGQWDRGGTGWADPGGRARWSQHPTVARGGGPAGLRFLGGQGRTGEQRAPL